ncbi:MAG TPA: SDR family NAD(P)-dependent oxidoreductase, partial [Solirubrobacteraceae bacterium]
MPELSDRVALVTGASRGAGAAIAAVLGEAGATVYVTGRSSRAGARTDDMPGTVEDAAAEVSARGGTGIGVVCDHTDPAQVEALVARVEAEHGRLDVLVNNA